MFSLQLPPLCAPLLFNSPHSGDVYSDMFVASSRLKLANLRKGEDIYVQELFSDVVAKGLGLMQAHFPRTFLDLNRTPFELDPLLFEETLPDYAESESEKVKMGLGILPRIGAEGQAIYKEKLALEEAFTRIDRHYHPYHAALHEALLSIHRTFAKVLLVDCHSMPARATHYSGVDIVLGDRHGTSCSPQIVDYAMKVFESMGLRVALNKPFAGGFITSHYGRPQYGFHALQIEISRSLYVNEQSLQRTDNFAPLKVAMTHFAGEMAAFMQPIQYAMAAE